MQEDNIELTSNDSLWERLLEYGQRLAALEAQRAMVERICKTQDENAFNVVPCQVLRDIFGFAQPRIIRTEKTTAAINKAAGAAKARAAKAAKKAEPTKSPADMLKEIAGKKTMKKATPKDYTLLRTLQKEGLTVEEMVKETHFTKESILAVLNDIPKLKEVE